MSYIVLATAAWIRPRHLTGTKLLGTGGGVLALLLGTFAGFLLFSGLVVANMVESELQASPLSHTVFWLCTAIGAGVVGGFLSGHVLGRVLDATGAS